MEADVTKKDSGAAFPAALSSRKSQGGHEPRRVLLWSWTFSLKPDKIPGVLIFTQASDI